MCVGIWQGDKGVRDMAEVISQLLPTNLALALCRTSMPDEDEKALRIKAAAHIQSRKAGETENQSDPDFWETLPFEQPRSRARSQGRSRTQAKTKNSQSVPSHSGGNQQQNINKPSGSSGRLQRSDLDPKVGSYSLHHDELLKRSKAELHHMCIWYDLKRSGTTKAEYIQRLSDFATGRQDLGSAQTGSSASTAVAAQH
ncbi:hypothetical protein PQX77_019783 [Marasmius sp. AFHP31]|nr:hypothetical protein PQX77_019783 [Marasmius sp. AFHP31]